MDKIFSISLSLLLFATSSVSAQDYCMKAPIGYGENATGGFGGNVVTVKTRTELSNALKASGAAVIIVTENITFGQGEMIKLPVQNKTLLGMNGVRLISNAQVKDGGILQLSSSSNNVIIRNLIFEGPGAYDVDGNDLLQNVGCTNLWVDHCEFYDGVDGNFDNTKQADNITISWCKFGYNKPPKASIPASELKTVITSASGATLTVNAEDGSLSAYTSILFPQQETERWVQTTDAIRIENIQVKEIYLYNLSGTKIRYVSSSPIMNLNSLNNKLYIVSALSTDGKIFNKKIIKY